MLYRLRNKDILQVVGDYQNIGVLDDFCYIKSLDPLAYPFEVIQSLPKELEIKIQEELYQAKQNKNKELKNTCDSLLSCFESDALGEVYMYESDLESQLNLMGLVIANLDADFPCRRAQEEKQNILHTKEQISTVYSHWLNHKSKVISKYQSLKQKVNNSLTLEEVNSITFNSPIT